MSTKHGVKTLESMSLAHWYNRWILKKISNYLKGDILEVGCGIGNFTGKLTGFGRVTAIDIDSQHLKDTKNYLQKKAEIGYGDIEKPEYFFREKKFDSIVCVNVLEHIENDQRALKNMYSLLKDGGFLILLVPAHEFLYGKIDKSIGHFRRYNKDSLKKILIQSSFQINKMRILNLLGAIGWFVSSRLFSESIVDENKLKIFNLIAPFILPIEDIIEPPFGTSILVIAKK